MTTHAKVFLECISNECIGCPKLDVDVITKELMNVVTDYKTGESKSIPNGYYNSLRCKYVDECAKIFEEGYKVVKEETKDIYVKPDWEEKEIYKIEKKPTTRKRTSKPKTEENKPTKTKKVSKK